MHDETLSADVRALLDASIDSVEALDTWMVLQDDPARFWSVGELAAALDIAPAGARRALAELASRGLAADAGEDRFRLLPVAAASSDAFARLRDVCRGHRRAVTHYLARRSLGRLRVLANAFTRGRS